MDWWCTTHWLIHIVVCVFISPAFTLFVCLYHQHLRCVCVYITSIYVVCAFISPAFTLFVRLYHQHLRCLCVYITSIYVVCAFISPAFTLFVRLYHQHLCAHLHCIKACDRYSINSPYDCIDEAGYALSIYLLTFWYIHVKVGIRSHFCTVHITTYLQQRAKHPLSESGRACKM